MTREALRMDIYHPQYRHGSEYGELAHERAKVARRQARRLEKNPRRITVWDVTIAAAALGAMLWWALRR